MLVIDKMETQIQFKLMKEEKELIKESALKIGLGMSQYVRNIVLKYIRQEAISINS